MVFLFLYRGSKECARAGGEKVYQCRSLDAMRAPRLVASANKTQLEEGNLSNQFAHPVGAPTLSRHRPRPKHPENVPK